MTISVKGVVSSIAALGLVLVAAANPTFAGNYGSGMKSTDGSYGMKQSAKKTVDYSSKADIVDTAVAAGNFNTLVTAVKAAGLVNTLKGKGPYTVFAPTDEAFSKIPTAKLNALLADKAALTKVLTYHVLPGRIMSSDLAAKRLTTAKTVQGQSVDIDARASVKVNQANVETADIVTSNGVIHVIDSVILPPDMISSADMKKRTSSY